MPDTETAERRRRLLGVRGHLPPSVFGGGAGAIDRAGAIDARADGSLNVDVTLGFVREADRLKDKCWGGRTAVGAAFSFRASGGTGSVRLVQRVDAPRLWTAEPRTSIPCGSTCVRGRRRCTRSTPRFGFRTFEVAGGQGCYLNGQRILLKGVGRRILPARNRPRARLQDNYDDVRLIKSMNMNAVRMTHYPPDVAFLEACDELGLYVLDEFERLAARARYGGGPPAGARDGDSGCEPSQQFLFGTTETKAAGTATGRRVRAL